MTPREIRHDKRHDFFDAYPWVMFIIGLAAALFAAVATLAVRHFFGLGWMLVSALPFITSYFLSGKLSAPRCPRCSNAHGSADASGATETHNTAPRANQLSTGPPNPRHTTSHRRRLPPPPPRQALKSQIPSP